MTEHRVESGLQPSPWLGLGVFLAIAVTGLVLVRCTALGQWLNRDNITDLSDRLGPWGIALLLLIGAVSPLLFLPRWPVAFAAGLLYGVMWGALIATVASTMGAVLHFLLARNLLAPATRRLMKRHQPMLDTVPADKTFVTILLLRAFPLSNFVATNLAAGAFRVRLLPYVAASFLGMIPSSVMYACWGKLMKRPTAWFYVLAAGTLVVIVAGSIAVRRSPWFGRTSKNTHVKT